VKKWVSLAVILVLIIISRGLILTLFTVVPIADLYLEMTRDHRYKWTPWPLTRRTYRALFVSKPRTPPVTYAPPPSELPAPAGRRQSRHIPQAVKVAVAARDGGRCRQCGSDEDIQFDHVYPWSRGGTPTVDNIQLLCGRCNRSKSAM